MNCNHLFSASFSFFLWTFFKTKKMIKEGIERKKRTKILILRTTKNNLFQPSVGSLCLAVFLFESFNVLSFSDSLSGQITDGASVRQFHSLQGHNFLSAWIDVTTSIAGYQVRTCAAVVTFWNCNSYSFSSTLFLSLILPSKSWKCQTTEFM